MTRYIGRHGTKRVAAAVLIGAVPPVLVKSASNPEGIPIEVFDGLRSSLIKDRSQFGKDFAIMFYGANRPGAKVSQGMLDQFWLWSMRGGLKNVYDSIKAFSETDFHEDLKKFDVPTLVMPGEDDQIVPINISGKRSAKLIKGAKVTRHLAGKVCCPRDWEGSRLRPFSSGGETSRRICPFSSPQGMNWALDLSAGSF